MYDINPAGFLSEARKNKKGKIQAEKFQPEKLRRKSD